MGASKSTERKYSGTESLGTTKKRKRKRKRTKEEKTKEKRKRTQWKKGRRLPDYCEKTAQHPNHPPTIKQKTDPLTPPKSNLQK
jgi:hypothetical protein